MSSMMERLYDGEEITLSLYDPEIIEVIKLRTGTKYGMYIKCELNKGREGSTSYDFKVSDSDLEMFRMEYDMEML